MEILNLLGDALNNLLYLYNLQFYNIKILMNANTVYLCERACNLC